MSSLTCQQRSLKFAVGFLTVREAFDYQSWQLETLSEDQAAYIGVTVQGPFKSDAYRY